MLSACCVLCQQSLDFFNICNLLCDMRYVLTFLHRAVHSADTPVHDPDTLSCGTGVLFTPLSHLNPLGEEPQKFRRQFVSGLPPNRSPHSACIFLMARTILLVSLLL